VRGARGTNGGILEALERTASEPVEFYPVSFQERLEHLLPRVGDKIAGQARTGARRDIDRVCGAF